jgi:hypothetical protein
MNNAGLQITSFQQLPVLNGIRPYGHRPIRFKLAGKDRHRPVAAIARNGSGHSRASSDKMFLWIQKREPAPRCPLKVLRQFDQSCSSIRPTAGSSRTRALVDRGIQTVPGRGLNTIAVSAVE